jgi:hypothetical protein
MRREDLVEMFKRIPERMHQYVNLVMHNQAVLSVDVVARFEPTYLVIRGREGGTTDEGRAFWVPYDEVSYVRVEQVLKLGDLKRLYGEEHADAEDALGRQAEAEEAAKAEAEARSQPKSDLTATPPPASAPTDPASVAKQNLLDRIRAARANAGATGRLGGK